MSPAHVLLKDEDFKTNRARHLYERLGFVVTEETASRYRMRWR